MAEESIGAMIRRLRLQHHWSMRQLADKSGVSTAWVSRIEKGERGQHRPDLHLLDAVADALGVRRNVLRRKAGYELEEERVTHNAVIREAKDLLEKTLVFLGEGEQLRKLTERDLVYLPLIGHIRAGGPDVIERDHEPVLALFVTPSMREWLGHISRPQALIVVGDSMTPRLNPGDRVILDPDATPHSGQIVVALIGGESTVKIFLRTDGEAILRSTHPEEYPDIHVRSEQMGLIQGVVRARVPPTQIDIIDKG